MIVLNYMSKCVVEIDGKKIKQVKEFVYLGCDEERHRKKSKKGK